MLKPDIPIYKITWIDVNSESGWADMETITGWAHLSYQLEHCESVGWLIKEEKHYIVLAGSHNGAGEYGERIMIPKSLITERVLIKLHNEQ